MSKLLERLLAKSVQAGDCVEWSGCRDPRGYGRTKTKGRTALVHRLVYEETHNVILPREIEVRHSCDNPPCLLIDHLIPGTHLDNMRDMIERGRHWRGPASMAVGATPEQIRCILSFPRQVTAASIARRVGLSPYTVRKVRSMDTGYQIRV